MEPLKRHIERIKKKAIVKVDGEDCIMLDMSKVGMRIVTPFLLKKRDITVSFKMKDVSLDLSCHVCWIKKELDIYHQPQYQVGLNIPDPPEEYIRFMESQEHLS